MSGKRLGEADRPGKRGFGLLAALVAGLALAVAFAGPGLAGSVPDRETGDPSTPVSEQGVVPTFWEGNPDCEDIGYGFGFKIDGQPVGDDLEFTFTAVNLPPGQNGIKTVLTGGAPSDPNNSVTIDSDGTFFDWESTIGIDAVIVKGGPDANAYVYVPEDTADGGLASPLLDNGNRPGISHIEFCYDYELDVSKTANTSFTRTYDWTIDKSADQDDLGELSPEQAPITVNYEVLVDLDDPAYVDSDHKVTGTITIENNTPLDADIDAISDLIQPGDISPDTLECEDEDENPFEPPATLLAGETVTCEYSAGPQDPDEPFGEKNTVEVTTDEESDVGGDSAEAEIDWDAATITHVDECVDVYDDNGTSGDTGDDVFLGTVCAFETDEETGEFAPPPKTFEFSISFGPPGSGADIEFECGDNTYTNVASFVTNDTDTTDDDDHTITAFQNCPEVGDGCSLTIGYWKTHAGFGPQADVVTPLLPILLGTSGGLKTQNVTTAALAVQYLSFKGSNNVFAASNGINKLYAQLLGAKLSIAAGADGSAIASTIALADAFLATKNSTHWSGLTNAQKNTVNGWVSTLDQFNNGIIGPGHCGGQEES